jgi:succinate dehydrogenase flavin-adding protein (antitoxin of CptAB toxin-antitoxin module)
MKTTETPTNSENPVNSTVYNFRKFKTWLPDFPGFYESLYSFPDNDMEYTLFDDPCTIQDEIKDFILDKVFDHIDNTHYEQDVCKKYLEIWSEVAKESFPFIKSITYENLVSPREYNFSTDSINIIVELDLPALIAEFTKNKQAAADYIHEKYTSYDGFMSHYENDLDNWLITVEENSDHKIGAMLQYLSQNSGISEFESDGMYYAVCNNIYAGNYINYDKLVELVNDEFNINIKSLEDLENMDHVQTKQELRWQCWLTGKPDIFSDEMRWFWTD